MMQGQIGINMEFKVKKVIWLLLKVIFQIGLAILLVTLLVSLSAKAYDLGYRMFHTSAVTEGEGYEVTITISANDSVREIANRLESAGVIKDQEVFQLQKIFYGCKIKPGTYRLSTSSTSKEILQILNDGPKQEEETTQ